jgi:pimeloyl-ACP methyl ester carboxylesterase
MRVDSGGVTISYEVTGPDDGPAVVLLHGFPDCGHLWRHQVPALAAAGFRVIVPDQRGYGQSDKPADVDQYNLLLLAGDVGAVLDDLGVAKASLVGHDWGASVTWATATVVPEQVEKMVALSVGHPSAYRAAGFPQLQKGWYMLLFQEEGLAEQWLRDDGWKNFRAWSSYPEAETVIAELEANGSLTPGLNWYRANVPPATLVGPPVQLPPLQVPAMGVWSSGDFALVEEQMTGSAAHCENGFRYERLDGPGHWMQLEAPDEVNALLLDFLGS